MHMLIFMDVGESPPRSILLPLVQPQSPSPVIPVHQRPALNEHPEQGEHPQQAQQESTGSVQEHHQDSRYSHLPDWPAHGACYAHEERDGDEPVWHDQQGQDDQSGGAQVDAEGSDSIASRVDKVAALTAALASLAAA